MLGARAPAIVRVGIATRVVGVDVAQTGVATVVVVAAATGKAIKTCAVFGTFPICSFIFFYYLRS